MDREISAKKKRRRRQKSWARAVSGLCLFIILVILIRVALKPSLRLDELKLATVEIGEMQATLSASGNVQPEFEEIHTSPILSAILFIQRNLGDSVIRGDTIMILDTRETQAELANMRDELALRRNNVKKLNQQLELVLINILKNAIEAIGSWAAEGNSGFSGSDTKGGTIRITTTGTPAVLTMENNGVPIPPEAGSRLFEPFFTTKKTGQGIGLTLIREILLNHDCDFSLRTREDGITEFRIGFG